VSTNLTSAPVGSRQIARGVHMATKAQAEPQRHRHDPPRVPSDAAPPRRQQEVRQVPINAIEWSFVIRTIDETHLERLKGAARLPAIKVWEVKPGVYRGIDGYHRWRLTKDRGGDHVLAVLYRFAHSSEGEKAFQAECIRSNIHHGLPLTKAQRDAAILGFWNRWGRSEGRPHGETLDSIGNLFGLTRQRVHQIVNARPDDASEGRGFSSFARFTAATRRMSTLLSDSAFLDKLVDERADDVLNGLRELDHAIAAVLARHTSRRR
jgi:hypothetical protein